MRRNVLLVTLLCFWAVTVSTVTASAKKQPPPEPSWVQTGGIKEFPSDFYITGVGSAQVVYDDTAAAQAEAERHLAQALTTLSPAQRRVLLLRYYGHLSFEEIADILGCPLNTALSHCHRGLTALRKVLAQSATFTDSEPLE